MLVQDASFQASFLLGGQLRGREMRLFQIYAVSNLINATPDTPYLQIGEHKYGKPILDRAFKYGGAGIMDGVKLALLSMDSTIRSNLSVGFPLDLVVYRKDELKTALKIRIEDNDPYLQKLSVTGRMQSATAISNSHSRTGYKQSIDFCLAANLATYNMVLYVPELLSS